MATLTVWRFDDAAGAERAVTTVEQLQRQELIQLHDAATVTWEAGKKKPKTRHLADMTGRGALGGAFWGFLFGLIFFIPVLGLAVGAAAGAIGGSLAHVGIDKDFIERVRAEVRPGSSALFLLTSGAVADRVHDAFEGSHAQLIETNLSESDEQALREAFADEA
ncbi:DUF1269 domain-containing protein [Conexibacter stalactiti]|uniref:DUF1269 domain-containing protein n=1 Tax=Conexibacter stalactiti TaxID=1940611 RepID=A0ABU4HQD6_9ACTN|nr:DUF1269 domain-containing protein [Conexibacter stalactiti]MDW5595455.1 DUF1269 domain-containing protein [Conexibacter stalactiti]MEC5036097.1 DUF1269 domain-containing protein [Conexibacter stalactiti]